jgi:hypothetical protein
MKTKPVYTWTASNNSTFLNGTREAPTLNAAVRTARAYLRSELNGEGFPYHLLRWRTLPH